jgi:hypothetical protein
MGLSCVSKLVSGVPVHGRLLACLSVTGQKMSYGPCNEENVYLETGMAMNVELSD